MEVQVGDTLLYRTKGFLPRMIRFFMKIYLRKKYGKKNPEYPICNHMSTVINYNNELYLGEAVSKGYVIHPLNIYDRINKDIFIYRPKEKFNESEKSNISKYAINLAFKQTEYEFLNFIWWMIYITTNFKIFVGGKKDKYVFCFESAFRCLNASSRKFYEKPYLVGSVDIQEDDRFEKISK